MVRNSFLVRLSHPLLHAGLSRRLLNHLVRPIQDVGRYREANLLCCFQINHQLKLHWLLHRQVGGLRTFQDFIDEYGSPPPLVRQVRADR
jgi:hypothetical protein